MKRGLARAGLALLILALGPASAAAQAAGPADRAALFERILNFGTLVRGGSVSPNWLADGSSFWYAEGVPDRTVVYRVDPKSNTKQPFFDVSRLRRSLAATLGHEPPYQAVPFETFTLIDGERAARFSLEGRAFRLDLAGYTITPLPVPAPAERDREEPRLVRRGFPTTNPDVYELKSPDGRWLASEREHDLWLRSTADGRSEPLTADGSEERDWSVAGARWSPDGLRLAAIRTDNRGVLRVPLVHWLKPTEEIEWRYFAKAGAPFPRPELFILDILSKRVVPVNLGEDPEPYVSVAGWAPDGSAVWVLANSREQKRLRLLAVDPATGAARVVLTETQPTFIKGIATNPGWRDLFTPLDDGKRFIWISERDGWDHLYLYGMDGTLIRRLTSGTWPVLKVVAVDTKGGWVYFTGHAEPRLYDTHLYRVGLDGQGFTRLTEAAGQHSAVFSPSKEFFLDTRSSLTQPPVVELRSAAGKPLQTLSTANIDSLTALGWTPPEEFVAKAADGRTDLYGMLFKPVRFDSTRRYPVVEYLYNGPQTTVLPRTFLTSAGQQAMAQIGAVIFVVDGRGTPERGKGFQDVVYGHFGRNEIPDHVAALKQVAATRSYMDMSRVGIYGGSWGGYMTVRAMVLAPEVYHVGVSIYPVVEMFDHMALAIEPYMGLPQSNPAGYQEGSSTARVGNLKGKLLLIHGTSDMNATFSATMKMVEALTRAGKPYDLVVLPEVNHSLPRYGLDRVRQYFEEHLKP